MAGDHEPAGLGEIPGGEGLCEPSDSVALGDDVPSATPECLVGDSENGFGVDSSEGAEMIGGGLAFGTPCGVGGLREVPGFPGMDHNEFGGLGDPDACGRQVVEVDEHRGAVDCTGGHELIHDAAPHAGRCFLSFLAYLRDAFRLAT